MKKYTAQNHRWKESKALGFFLNFINNHKGVIDDNDVFDLVASLRTHAQWIGLIKAAFPKGSLKRMEHSVSCRNRLDYDDDAQEMFREIWYSEFARTRLRKMFASVISDELAKHPIEQHATDPFAQKVQELQRTLKLTDFEADVLLVCSVEIAAAGFDQSVFVSKGLQIFLRFAVQDDVVTGDGTPVEVSAQVVHVLAHDQSHFLSPN